LDDNKKLEDKLKSMEYLLEEARSKLNAAENEKHNLMLFSSLFFVFVLIAFDGGFEIGSETILSSIISILFYAFSLAASAVLFSIAIMLIDTFIQGRVNTSKESTIYFAIFAIVAAAILCFI